MAESTGYTEYVLRARAGDKQAFSELVKRFHGMVLTTAIRHLSNPSLAEDAVQEALATAFISLPSLRDSKAFPAWLRAIVRTCCYRLERKERQLPPAPVDGLDIIDPSPGPFETMVRYQTRNMVAATLQSLDGVAREACIQRFILGRPYKEISERLGVPVGTIKRRLHDARHAIVSRFQEQDQHIIRVGYLPISDHLLGMVSHSANTSRVRIHLKKYLSWASLIQALESGLLDAAYIMAPLALWLRNQGVPIVYVMDAHHEGSALTVRNDLNEKGLASDNRIGMPYAISTHSMLLSAVMDKGAAANPSGRRYRGPSYLILCLANRDIDAFFCAEPWNTKAAMDGSGRILLRSRDMLPGHICCILAVQEHYARTRGDVLCDYLKQVLAANDAIRTNLHRSARIQEQYTGVPASVIEHVLDQGHVSFDDILPDRGRMESLMCLAMETGLLDGPCDLSTFLRADLV